MTTYVIMQNRISNELRRGSTASASGIESEIQNAILTAIEHYERKRFYFNQQITTFSTVADREYYDSSDLADIPNIIMIDAMKVTLDSSVDDPMAERTFRDIDASQDGTVTGDPFFYAYYAQKIRLYPKPNTVRTVTLAIHYRLDALSDGSDSNAWTTDAEELIRQRAKYILALDVEQDDGLATRSRALESEALSALQAETARRMPQRLITEVAGMTGPGGWSITRGS